MIYITPEAEYYEIGDHHTNAKYINNPCGPHSDLLSGNFPMADLSLMKRN